LIQTAEAVVDAAGRIQLLGEVHVDGLRRALATVLDEPAAVPGDAAILAEAGLGGGLASRRGGRRVVSPTGGRPGTTDDSYQRHIG
jgi:hypothetical protein